jgi:hypothetical protein
MCGLEKKVGNEKDNLQRKSLAPPYQPFFFFSCDVPYPNNDFHQK